MPKSDARPGLTKVRSRSELRARAEAAAAHAIETVLSGHQAAGELRHANRRLAARIPVNESMVRDWRAGNRATPLWFVASLPTELALEVLAVLKAELLSAASDNPERTQRLLSASVGELACALDEALLDGALDSSERAMLARLLRKVELQAGTAAHSLAAGGHR